MTLTKENVANAAICDVGALSSVEVFRRDALIQRGQRIAASF